METTEKINVRGAISALEIGGEPLELLNAVSVGEENGYKPSSIRNTASSITSDTGRKFTVSVTDELITVTRNY